MLAAPSAARRGQLAPCPAAVVRRRRGRDRKAANQVGGRLRPFRRRRKHHLEEPERVPPLPVQRRVVGAGGAIRCSVAHPEHRGEPRGAVRRPAHTECRQVLHHHAARVPGAGESACRHRAAGPHENPGAPPTIVRTMLVCFRGVALAARGSVFVGRAPAALPPSPVASAIRPALRLSFTMTSTVPFLRFRSSVGTQSASCRAVQAASPAGWGVNQGGTEPMERRMTQSVRDPRAASPIQFFDKA